jgi:hypothetical protein
MTDAEFGQLLEEAKAELGRKQDTLQADYLLGSFPRWWFDQATEKLQFVDQYGHALVEADVVDIGSFSPKSKTWKWAWCNDSVLPSLREKAKRLKELEALTGSELFGREEPFEVDEPMAWELAALAVKHLGAKGCYRAPSSSIDGPHTFLAITEVHRVANQ